MNSRTTLTICAFLSVNLLTGCSSFKSLTSNDVDPDDPLSIDRKVSPTYKLAKRELDKSASSTVMKFARWREDLSDFEEAKKQYMDVLADDPDNVEARLGVARVEFKSGHKLEAEKILAATTRKFPNETNAWIEMGRVYSSQEKYNEAVSSFRSAVNTDSSSRLANYELGVTLARMNQLEDAHRHLAIAGGDSAAYYNIGYILHEAGRSQDAADWARKALASKPDEKTQSSAEKLLATLGRPLSPQVDGTQLAANSAPYVDQQRTTYRQFTEAPGPDGIMPASMTSQQPAIGASAPFGRTSSFNTAPQFSGSSTGIDIAGSGTFNSLPPVHTANLQRSLPSFEQQQSSVPQWNGPAMSGQPSVVPAASINGQPSQSVEPPAWRSYQPRDN